MNSADQLRRLAVFTEKSLRDIAKDLAPRNGSRIIGVDKLAMVAGFAGARPYNEGILGRTLALGFRDPSTGKIASQTVPIRNFDINPFSIEELDKHHGILRVGDLNVKGLPQTQWDVVFGANFLRHKNHHFNQADRSFNHLPVSLGANPRTYCENRCPSCSRAAMGFFEQMPPDFIERHVREVSEDFERRFPGVPKSEMKYIGLMTGSPLCAENEVKMVLEVIQTYRNFGFNDAGFAIFSHLVENEADMKKISDAGVVGFVATLETFDDTLRKKCWAGKKGSRSAKDYFEILDRAKRYFRFVEATLVFGLEPYAEVEKGMKTLAGMEVMISASIPRSYNLEQLDSIHPDVWNMGLPYFTESMIFALSNNAKIPNTPQHMRDLALDWMRRQNPDAKETDLPYKYRV